MHITKVFVALALFCGSITLNAQELVRVSLEFENVRNSKGQILVGVYADEDAFKNERMLDYIVIPKRDLRDGKVFYEVELPAGTYGLAVCDDENENNEMDYNFVGWPKEGFGFSNLRHTGLSKPPFNEFKFTLRAGRASRIKVPLRYL